MIRLSVRDYIWQETIINSSTKGRTPIGNAIVLLVPGQSLSNLCTLSPSEEQRVNFIHIELHMYWGRDDEEVKWISVRLMHRNSISCFLPLSIREKAVPTA